MKNIELLSSFEIELNKLQDNLTKPTSTITEYWLNAGLSKFWKTRYSLMNVKRESFEQSQKRIDDLRLLIANYLYEDIDITTDKESLYTVTIPEDYAILLGDTAGIAPLDGADMPCWEKDAKGNYVVKFSDTIEGTIDTVDRIKENSLSEYRLRYNKARPIRLVVGDIIELHTDGKYKVSKYKINYLRLPSKIDLHTAPFDEYLDMPQHAQSEIVKLAVQMYLEN